MTSPVLERDAQSMGLDTPGRVSRGRVTGVGVAVVVILVISAMGLLFGREPLAELPGFTWAYALAYLLLSVLTVGLLWREIVRSPSLSINLLMSAFAYSAVMSITFFLTFPDIFGNGVVLGGPQTSIWIYYLWRLGFLGLLAASGIAAVAAARRDSPGPGNPVFGFMIAGILAVVVVIGTIGFAGSLPILIIRGFASESLLPGFYVLSYATLGVALIALIASVWSSVGGSQLRLWLVVVSVLYAADIVIHVAASDRYTLGWYLPRLLAIIGSALLLIVLLRDILAQSRALAAEREHSAGLAQIIQQSPLCYFLLDGSGSISEVNRSLTGLLHSEEQELLGRPLVSLLEPESARIVTHLLDDVRRGDSDTIDLRVKLMTSDSNPVWVDLLIHPLNAPHGSHRFSGSMTDVSDVVSAEVASNAPVGIGVVSASGRIVQVNDILCRLIGIPRSKILEAPAAIISDSLGGSPIADQFASLANDGHDDSTIEFELVDSKKQPIWISSYQRATRDAQGRFSGTNIHLVDVTERRQAQAAIAEAQRRLVYRSTHDAMTGQLNSTALIEKMNSWAHTIHDQQRIGLVLIDIDGFQQISNSMTREQGDAVLTQLADFLSTRLPEKAEIARTGGDSFGIAMIEQRTRELEEFMRTVVREISEHRFGLPEHQVQISVSVGMTHGMAGARATDLMQEADLAIRDAKAHGRGEFSAFDQVMRADVVDRVHIAGLIRSGLKGNEFEVWYQPVVDIATRSIVGYEALSRWRTPTGLVAPNLFLPVAEETGLIVPIGQAGLADVINTLRDVPEGQRIAVNASATQLLSGGFAASIFHELSNSGMPPTRLILEITEQALFDAQYAAKADLFRLADAGIQIYVDDFGTGYSSITHIRNFPIAGIKLDQSFTAGVLTPNDPAVELAAVLGELANRLDLDAVAEGVETEDQARRVLELGWTLGQGWLFGKPAPTPQGFSRISA